MRFDLVDLRLFVSVAACGNLTRAAESLPIALGAASARIKALEESLRTPLLERKSRGVVLTPAGDAFLERALAILRETASLREDLHRFRTGMRGRIRLFANTNAINEYPPNLLSRFLTEHPEINVEMEEHTSQDIVRAVDEDRADLGIIGAGINTRRLEIHPFREDYLVVIVPMGHALAGKRSIRFHQVLEWEFVGLGDRASVQIYLSKIATLLGQSIQFRIQVGSFDAACRMVAAGVGISIIPKSAARRLQRSLRMHVVRINKDWARRDLKIVTRSAVALAPPSRMLFEHLTMAT